MSDILFEIRNLTYSNSEGNIDDISLNLVNNEIHALVVKSSSEQSILIESLINLQENQSVDGTFRIKGKLLNNRTIDRNTLALLHQKPKLINDFTVAENLSLGSIPTRGFLPFVHWRKVKQKAKDILEKTDFELNHKTKAKNLSKENKRIVNILSVLLRNPEMIVMHEPMEGLSAKNASKLMKIIQQYKDDGGSILYITKQWEEALKIADRISILSKGKIKDEMAADIAKKDPQRLLRQLEDYNYKDRDGVKDDETQNVLEAVFKAAEFLTSEYELKDVLLLLAKEVTKVMGADGCSISLIDEQTWSIIDRFEFKKKQELQAQLKKDAIIKIARENGIYYTSQHNRVFTSLFEKIDNVKTVICIPVLIKSQVTGIIQMFYEDFYVYSKDESKYLSAFARHAAIAIEDTRLMGRSALLQESHHRIKNNLQSIVGLIALQKRFVDKHPENSVEETLDNIISRVKSIAAVHDLLSKDKLGRSIINVKDIIEAIVSFNNVDPNIIINLDLENIFIPYNKASSIALIINELLTNCYKHAFRERETGIISIVCKRIHDSVELSVSDNGRGIPEDFDLNKLDSLGLTILKGIVTSEFRGEMEITGEGGTNIISRFPTERIFLHK
ncbi:histidine kinase dimerization/phosphoacceptor domain -containing protein [Halalkalibacter alkaliphilus]|uniref:ATP-binding cassette domain-containing protein n=1 Tax=Halalkalibacter alkaliphilus TaxID=2917993 RepID=A0A9X2A4Q8_9BACI|nr:histidine kinase dimerization/phosphoacceptor domain -containing protein [Halalkalibacter alkaliphilus]MCL7746843.1 ATP-binding cassette domain-containing protein [Halalkalibacter alkaliphilus]